MARSWRYALAAAVLGWGVGIAAPMAAAQGVAMAAANRGHEAVRPLPAPTGLDPQKVALGRRLFHDPTLASDGRVSCATCHPLDRGGVDGLPVSVGVNGARGTTNAPTVYNSGFNLAQFWDGRAQTLEEQAGGPLTHPSEMAADWPSILERLNASSYAAEFRRVYGSVATEVHVRDAIATFERSLVTLNAPFDRWLGGDDKALNADQKRGYTLFKSYGCAACHQGVNVGGNMFARFGYYGNWFEDRGHSTKVELGRFNVTGRESDRYVFKVPSLRLVTLTAPYFHDGSIADLRQAIRLMARYQLGRDIPDADIDPIIAFLGSLVDPAQLQHAP